MGSTAVRVIYEGAAITDADGEPIKGEYMFDTAGDLIEVEYNDNQDGQVDSLEIVVRNREALWCKEWRPQIGAKLQASILPTFGTGELVCGDMWVDEIEVGGPPSVASIRAVSVPVKSEARGTKRTRAWESVTFQQMAKEIAKAAGLELRYQGEEIEIDRTDQHEETDFELLRRLADDYGFVVKASSSKLVVYDQMLLEDASSVAVVDVGKGDGLVKRWSVRAKTRDVYRAARVMYRNPINKIVDDALRDLANKEPKEPVFVPLKPRGKHRRPTKSQQKARDKAREEKHQAVYDKRHDAYLSSLIRQAREEERREPQEVEVDDREFIYTPDGAPLVGAVLEIEKRVKDLDAAKRLAERKLRDANKRAVELSLELAGDVAMRASLNLELVRAGDFSGKYHIDQASHRVSGRQGYVTSITAHRVLSFG